MQKQQDNLHLSRLGIKEGETEKGHGTQLLLFTLEKAKEYNKKKITCKAPEDAWPFYQRVGFTKLSEYDDPHWGKSALMELKLTLTRH